MNTGVAVVDAVPGSREPLVTRRGIQEDSDLTPRRRRITPFRLVAVCMVLLVAGTVWWSVREFQFSNVAGQLGDLARSGLESFVWGDLNAPAPDQGFAPRVVDPLD
ncbi:MAG: hypothetical protein VX311_01885, partial [Planctomycetota bacterium]|nr:hypothetical protein [Planctomycetota bacterium]